MPSAKSSVFHSVRRAGFPYLLSAGMPSAFSCSFLNTSFPYLHFFVTQLLTANKMGDREETFPGKSKLKNDKFNL